MEDGLTEGTLDGCLDTLGLFDGEDEGTVDGRDETLGCCDGWSDGDDEGACDTLGAVDGGSETPPNVGKSVEVGLLGRLLLLLLLPLLLLLLPLFELEENWSFRFLRLRRKILRRCCRVSPSEIEPCDIKPLDFLNLKRSGGCCLALNLPSPYDALSFSMEYLGAVILP